MKYFKRNGFVALVSMLSLTAYAGDSLPLSVAVSETKEFIQVSGHGIDTSNVIQQERIIQGTVLEEGTNEPLVGVNVVVKGTTIGTTTDIDGKYSIKIPSDKAILVFSYIGQKTEEYSVKGLNFLNVIMKSDATMLSEVVVYTGYMTQKKADLTGSVAMANASDLKKNASANAMKSLQGKMAGVHITTNGGNPAEGTTVQIRGLSSLSGGVKPLIVLDGMPTENLNLRDINSGDIESIQVLKDAASASIYGARASGGVILIQTKKGQAGKTNIEYNGSVSINTVLNKPTLMNAEQYGRAAFQAQAYDERVYGTSISLPSAYNYTWHRGDNGIAVLDEVKVAEYLNADQTVRGSDTDWMGEIFQTAISHNHQLTISNGSEKSKSLFSLGYFNNEGTQIHTFFRQYSIRANTEYSLIKNHLKVGENLAVSYLQYRDQSETWWAMINPPASPVYDENGGWAGAPGFDDFTNPVRLLTMNKDNINNYVKIIGNIFLDLNIWKGISARTQFGLDYGNAYNRAVDGVWSETGGRNSDGENYVGSYQSHPLSYVWTNTLSYTLSTGKHNLDVVLGTEATRFVQEGFSARREGIYLEDRDFAHIGVTTGEKYNLGSSADEYTYFSLFGKANYVYNGKYLLSATVRRDGSSLFGENNRYATFPAFSVGWRIKDEAFMEDFDFLSDLKLRASWGANGSVQGLPRGYTTTPFTTDYFGTSYPIQGNESGPLYSGYKRTWLGNPDLKWETTTQTDLAVDFGFFNQRLTGSLGYYFKKTKDILVQTPYIAVMGEGGEPWINGANMNNQGLEFEVSFRNDPSAEFQYTISANIGTYKTKLTELPENVINKYPGDGVRDFVIGRSPNVFYGLVADGIFKTQEEVDNHAEQPGKAIGRIRYKDLDGDGRVDELTDRTYIGTADPDFFGGITFDFKYRNFDLNMFFQGVFGNQVSNDWKRQSDFWHISGSVPVGKNHPTRLLDAWSFDNPDSDIPAMTNVMTNNEQRMSTYYIEDGSYLKLRNIELGYTFPAKITNKMMMKNLRVYASARNVFTLKKFWGDDQFTSFDPEMSGYGYLTPFTMTFGLNVTFYSEKDGRPDTYVITGDIDAMWLRDSSAQVYPYLDFMSEDKNLQRLIIGVINKQTSFILKDPYANAFYDDDTKYTRWNSDHTEMKPGIHERKYELDSLCYPIRLAYGYWKKTNDASPFDAQWKKAIETVLRVCKEQQRKDGNGPYSFRRTSEWAIDAVPMGGVGYKVNPVGLICSTFRPSDDATIFPFLVPSNFFAVASLRQASEMVQKITKDNVLADELLALSKEVYNALQTYAVVNHPKFGKIYAFEIDGFGSAYLSDDANVPNLLALPYLGGVDSDDAIYANTRRFVWSEYNPYFFKGSYFEGIGGHHIGTDMIWPMSLIMKALTAQDDKELQQCIQMLQKTHAGTGFMHESFHKDDPKKFTRSWFAWANTLFGELLWKTFNEKPYLLEY